jgi:hypothetical protein
MSAQPKALFLADVIEADPTSAAHHDEAAAELRRLTAVEVQRDALRQIVEDFPPIEAELQEVSDRAHRLETQRDALLETLKEADDLLRIARDAMWKLGLNGLGSDCRLSHEVRMFALDFSAESRDGPGVLQVNGTGRLQKALASNRAAIKAVEGEKT